ncbi:hypothetical protein GCM10023080_029340 [Streptomyces pseudoechinosporeus]
MTRETVVRPTPARAATVLMVGRCLPPMTPPSLLRCPDGSHLRALCQTVAERPQGPRAVQDIFPQRCGFDFLTDASRGGEAAGSRVGTFPSSFGNVPTGQIVPTERTVGLELRCVSAAARRTK